MLRLEFLDGSQRDASQPSGCDRPFAPSCSAGSRPVLAGTCGFLLNRKRKTPSISGFQPWTIRSDIGLSRSESIRRLSEQASELEPLLCLSRISIQPRGLQRRPTWQTGALSEWPRACYFVMGRSQRNENQNERQSRRGNDRLRPAAEIDSGDLVVVGAIHRGSLQSLRSITLGVILLTPARVVASGALTEVICDGQTIQ